ncbi:MAG: TIGR04283 family arsenosugar biosynthesis glycosyltransferase [Anaerolineae bacterium]
MVSIIVPVLNEAKVIESLLEHLLGLEGEHEVIVVDGGSSDDTAAIASRYVKVISSERGRARQMNAGAREARGEVLLFLHADCRLPAGAIRGIEAALADPACVGGCFTLSLGEEGLIYRLISLLSSLRMRLTGRMTGDEGIFVRREIFVRMGGFPEIALMEDWEFSRRLRSYGRVKQLPLKITTSARRWKKCGLWRTIWLMQKIKILYALNMPPEKLKRLYDDIR